MKEEKQIPEMGTKEIDLAARIFCLALINTGAETMIMTQENFHGYGQKFGDLKVIRRSDQGKMIWWLCECWCGNTRLVEEKRLLSGHITMCIGCEVRQKMEKPIEIEENYGR